MTATTHPRWQRNTHLPRFYPIARRFHNLCMLPFLSVTLCGGTMTNSRFPKGSTCRVRDQLELQLAMLVWFPSRVEKGAPSPSNDTDTNHTAGVAPSWGGTCWIWDRLRWINLQDFTLASKHLPKSLVRWSWHEMIEMFEVTRWRWHIEQIGWRWSWHEVSSVILIYAM